MVFFSSLREISTEPDSLVCTLKDNCKVYSKTRGEKTRETPNEIPAFLLGRKRQIWFNSKKTISFE